jgi:hypothetical protein
VHLIRSDKLVWLDAQRGNGSPAIRRNLRRIVSGSESAVQRVIYPDADAAAASKEAVSQPVGLRKQR